MPHVQLAGKRKITLGVTDVSQLLGSKVLKLLLHGTENLGDSIRAFGTLTEHIFRTGHGVKIDTRHTGTFLSPVVLFLHHKIELVKAEHPRSVLLLVVFQWFQQPYHCDSTLMLQWFHHI